MVQAEKRRLQNVQTKKTMKQSIKDFITATQSKDKKKISDTFKSAQSSIDTAVKKNVLDKKTAARKKSSLSAKAKVAGASTPSKKTPATKKTTAKKNTTKTPSKTTVKKS